MQHYRALWSEIGVHVQAAPSAERESLFEDFMKEKEKEYPRLPVSNISTCQGTPLLCVVVVSHSVCAGSAERGEGVAV